MLADSPMAREFHSLNELVSEVSSFLGKDMAAAGIEVAAGPRAADAADQVARVDIQQLLINLTQNAAHAMAAHPAENRRIIIIQTRVSVPLGERAGERPRLRHSA